MKEVLPVQVLEMIQIAARCAGVLLILLQVEYHAPGMAAPVDELVGLLRQDRRTVRKQILLLADTKFVAVDKKCIALTSEGRQFLFGNTKNVQNLYAKNVRSNRSNLLKDRSIKIRSIEAKNARQFLL
jgi:hypothetical protein